MSAHLTPVYSMYSVYTLMCIFTSGQNGGHLKIALKCTKT